MTPNIPVMIMIASGFIIAMIGRIMIRLKQIEVEKQKFSAPQDISAELQQAIQGEFTRLRQENAEFRAKFAEIEKRLPGTAQPSALTPEQQAEINKILAAHKIQS
jgi:hypothetical protein